MSSAVTKPAQAQLTSKAPALTAPSLNCSAAEVPGEGWSGVSVPMADLRK